MSDTPDRIYASRDRGGGSYGVWDCDPLAEYEGKTEYIRTDLALPTVQPDREYIAFSMWKAEADRAAPNVGKHRTPEGFAEASDQDRTRWLMLADAAILALIGDEP